MWIRSDDFTDGQHIPERHGLCAYDEVSHVTFSQNLSPQLSWNDVPPGTDSFAILMIDIDVPTVGDDVNHEGREIPSTLARTDFTHWAIADIPRQVQQFATGQFSENVTPRGKPGLNGAPREGVNDYTGWFVGDAEMEGTYLGYDGPCPPWNDSVVHRYVFTLMALDVASLVLSRRFTAVEVRAAAGGHILAEATLTGTYTLNPRLR